MSRTTSMNADQPRFFSVGRGRERGHDRDDPDRDGETTGRDGHEPRDESAQQHNAVRFAVVVVVGCIQSGVVSSSRLPLPHPQWMQGYLGRCL